ncbi:glycoside hydrolase family protein [Echinicola marina]|uniref:glycoside hydrolase family protein n=1 Tax=Echinicola marina TaxID=2859768 RepID=UPI001CF61254|nr:glycoside hydrolase family protein [Echinicola marina]UCS95476.1 glycoside hydrolase family protein [Echinicola marina]
MHNPHIQLFEGKYHLYHTGSKYPSKQSPGSPGGNLSKRDLIQQSQQLGVVTFDSIEELLKGNITRYDKPLLSPRTRVKPDNVFNPSPKGTTALPDNLIVVNPAVVFRPSDGKYLLYFKGNIYAPSWRGVHGVAIGDTPIGPFYPKDKYVFDVKDENGQLASAEDPYVWYHSKSQKFYAIFKDFTGKITKGDPGLAIMSSNDGEKWEQMEQSMFMPLELQLKNGSKVQVKRLERPQLLIDENGLPKVLYAACAVEGPNAKKDGSSFNIQVPLISDYGK